MLRLIIIATLLMTSAILVQAGPLSFKPLLKKGQNVNNNVLYFIIDENKDRQISIATNNGSAKKRESFMLDDIRQAESITYLETIG